MKFEVLKPILKDGHIISSGEVDLTKKEEIERLEQLGAVKKVAAKTTKK